MSSLSTEEVRSSGRATAQRTAPVVARKSYRNVTALLALSLAATSPELWGQALEIEDTFTAVGRGETRATNALNLEDLEAATPGISPDKQIDLIPGVNVVTRDPFGFYEFGNDIRLRNFRVEQIAINLDGVPMGSNSPRFGTRIGRTIDNENLEEIKVQPGANDVDVPGYEALGGAILYSVRKPSQEMGAMLKGTYGDFDSRRMFVRFDTGEILPGLTSFISFSDFSFHTRGMHFESSRRHIDVVTRYEFPDEKGSINFQYAWNDRHDYDTVGIQYDRYMALEGPRLSASEAAATYSDSAAQVYAQFGYINYSPGDPRFAPGGSHELGLFRFGNFEDHARDLGPPGHIVHEVNGTTYGAGEYVNAIYQNMWRNGREDHFFRLVYDYDFTDSLRLEGNTYYQKKDNYGFWGVTTSASETEVKLGYAYSPGRTDITGADVVRDGTEAILLGPIMDDPDTDFDEGAFSGGTWTRDDVPPRPADTDTAALLEWRTTIDNIAEAMMIDPNEPVEGRTGRDEDFGGERFGFYNKLIWDVTPTTTITGGFWYEYDEHEANRPNYDFTDNGAVTGWFDYDQVLFNNYQRLFETDITMFFLQASQSLFEERLTLYAGVRSLTVERTLSGLITNQNWRENRSETRSVEYQDHFLPQFGVLFDLTDSIELFANYSKNIGAAEHESLATNFFEGEALDEETAQNVDAGIRYEGAAFSGSFAIYYSKYEDRILEIPSVDGASFLAGDDTFRNAGGVDSYGAEASVTWSTPLEGLRLIAVGAVQQSEFEDDLVVGSVNIGDMNNPELTDTDGDGFYNGRFITTERDVVTGDITGYIYEEVAAISGKSLGNTPEFTGQFEAVYNWNWLTVRFRGKYYGEVYVNTLNTEKLEDYTVAFGSITLRGPEGSSLDGFSLTVSADNLFDQEIAYARSYEDQNNGQVVTDRGRFLTITAKAEF